MDGGDKKTDQQTENAGWQYKPEASLDEPFTPAETSLPGRRDTTDDTVEWSASEFVAHDKSFGWYAILALVAALVAAGVYLIARDMFSAIAVVAMAVIFGIAGARKPRTVTYRIDAAGITIGRNFHPFREYKSFAMPQDGPFTSVVLVPMKRFGFPLSAYLAPDSEQKVLNILSEHLPMERGKLDAIEELMRQLRF